MRQEIEVKAKVSDLNRLASQLEAMGCAISEPIVQHDEVFINYTAPYDQMSSGSNFLRIRQGNGKILFTLKQPQVGELDCLEHEVEISDADEMRQAILLLGYHKAIEVHKTRRKTMCQGYEICLDTVEGLGDFVEVEKITENEDPETVQVELFDFLKQFGITDSDRVLRGYDTLLYLARQSS